MKVKQATARIAQRKGQSMTAGKRGRPERLPSDEFAELAMQALSYEELCERTGYTIKGARVRVSNLRKAGYRIPRMSSRKPDLRFECDNTAPVYRRRSPNNASYDPMDVLDYVIRYKTTYDGIAPTLREMCRELNLSSTSVAAYLLEKLEGQGFIKCIGSRAIMVTGGEWKLKEVMG